MTFESPEQEAKRVINEHPSLDSNFEAKFKEVAPFLNDYEENGKYPEDKLKQQQEQDNKDIKNIKAALEEINSKDPSKPNIIALETSMFSKEKIAERAKNRVSLMEKTNLSTPEKKQKPSLVFNDRLHPLQEKVNQKKGIDQRVKDLLKRIGLN